jgi:pimeloyl-ACP methyl ester carboxylesterase
VPHKYATVDGVATFLHHCGPTTLPEVVPDLGAGALVLCLHGAGGNGSEWREVMEALHAAGHSPLAFDQPGHGRSGGLDSLGSIERMVDFSRALVSKLGLRAPVLLGHGMGGAVALRWALDHPGELRAAALVGTAPRYADLGGTIDRVRRVTEGKERRAFARDRYAPGASPEVMQRGFLEQLKTDPRALFGDLLACRDFDVEARLGEVRVPVLAIRGAHESEALRRGGEALAAAVPRARSRVVEGAAHAVPLEQPAALAAAVSDFVAELPA